MIQGTTPTRTLRVVGMDLTPYDMWVSLRQLSRRRPNPHEVDITSDDITVELDGTDTLVSFTLTQEQSLGFVPGRVEAQINYGSESHRMATKPVTLPVEKNLYTGVIEFAETQDPDLTTDEVVVTIDTNIPDGSVTTRKLADGAVTGAKIANGTITWAKLDPSEVVEIDPTDIADMFDN